MTIKQFKKNLAAAAFAFAGFSACAQAQHNSMNWSEAVGRAGADRVVLPVNQVITPAGKQIELHGLRPQVLALSPDGKILVTSGKTHDVIVIDPDTGKILQKVVLPNDGPLTDTSAPASAHYLKPDHDEQVSYTGLVFSPDGSRLYLSNVKGSIKVFAVDANHHLTGLGSISLPYANAPWRKEEIPSGLAISADGKRLYVAGSLSNHLLEYELSSGKLMRTFDVGEVPYTVVLAGHKAYVSNWAGRRPDANSVTGWAGQGTKVRVNSRGVADEGSVSVIDLNSGMEITNILTGLHASALLVTPNGRYVCVANANSDTVSVISTATDKVVETIPMRWQAQDLFGASPDALAMDPIGQAALCLRWQPKRGGRYCLSSGKIEISGIDPPRKAGQFQVSWTDPHRLVSGSDCL
jgi:YVTN family beta-propeller protein